MSSPLPTTAPPARPQKLAIVHFLGWMLGVGAVLAIYRASDLSKGQPPEQALSIQLSQLGLGLAYGTAISGLGMFLWRWLRGTGQGPTQPGHWLLVFGGLGLLIDFGSTAAFKLGLLLAGSEIEMTHFGVWTGHQVLVWSLASLVAAAVVVRLLWKQDAPFWWTCVAIVTLLVLSANSIAYSISLWAFHAGKGGTWIWLVPQYVRVSSESLAIASVLFANVADLRVGFSRDWLHVGGVGAALGLGLVDVITSAYWLSR